MQYLKGCPKYSSTVYDTQHHPVISFDSKCKQCTATCGSAVSGAGPDDLSKVRLIVISDHAGAYEVKEKYPQVPNSLITFKRKSLLPRPRNSGQLLRDTIEELFDLCSWSEVWMTNGVKCDPTHEGRKLTLSDSSHIRKCAGAWLRNELEILDRYCPTAPILVAGSKALKALQSVDPNKVPAGKLEKMLRRKHYKFNDHPLAFTLNPAAYAKSEPKIETSIGIIKNKLVTTEIESMVGMMRTPLDDFYQDFAWLKNHISK